MTLRFPLGKCQCGCGGNTKVVLYLRNHAKRILPKVRYDWSTGCWHWLGGRLNEGYGELRRPESTKSVRAHRVSYEYYRGPIPEGLKLDHLCRNRDCVNPWHLEP